MKLLILEDNWADEIDFSATTVLSDEDYEKFLLGLDKIRWPRECYIGTNEEVQYESAKDFLECINVHDVPKEAQAFVKKVDLELGPWPLEPGSVISGKYVSEDEEAA